MTDPRPPLDRDAIKAEWEAAATAAFTAARLGKLNGDILARYRRARAEYEYAAGFAVHDRSDDFRVTNHFNRKP